ncbi:uncharacterized protein LOC116121755 [Pistacia vera]|uniref:uncharacterized protein LOC116121755 n=1 Tax=Pistacia vera TaxID=55513 RepID=UPI0012637DA9|nr:uncharacterized protein LOC116121755 [Pistacia vera]
MSGHLDGQLNAYEGNPIEGQKRSRANVVHERTLREKLQMKYHEPIVINGGTTMVRVPLSLTMEGRKKWGNCLVGSFIERKPLFHSVQFMTLKLSQKYEIKDIMMNEKGFFFFKFEEEAMMFQCLEDGPWLFQNKPILLQKWQPKMEINKEAPQFIPLWVKLFDVPLELWNAEGLSYIASGVGKPLGVDKIMEDTCRFGVGQISFARVLMEVDARCPLPAVTKIQMPNERNLALKVMDVKVEYQWHPSQCARCCVFGHGEVSCPRQPRVESQGNIMENVQNSPDKDEGFLKVSRRGKGKGVGGPRIDNRPNPQ